MDLGLETPALSKFLSLQGTGLLPMTCLCHWFLV